MMALVIPSYLSRRCPDCRHAEHPGRACNRAGGIPCSCGPYEWVDTSDWEAKPSEVKPPEVKPSEPEPIPSPARYHPEEWIRPSAPVEKISDLIDDHVILLSIIGIILCLLLVVVLVGFSEVGFSSSQN
jgi:hypothetical protein